MPSGQTTLYRAVSQKELDFIAETDFTAFPARLPHHPIFYPVIERAYAVQIARDWTSKDPNIGLRGYVVEFRIRSEFLSRYPVQRLENSPYREYWVPAEDLDEFNQNIIGLIQVVDRFENGQDAM